MNILIGLVLLLFSIYQAYDLAKNNFNNLTELAEEKHIGVNAYLRFFFGVIGGILLGIFILYKELFDGGFEWQPNP